ncbi:MAG: hypothetical protein V9H69_05500 [Anaerolineae bacterium]
MRLSEMRYNFEGATAQTRIKLRYDNGQPQANLRYDRSDYFDQWGGMHLYAIYKLLGVDVVALNGSGAGAGGAAVQRELPRPVRGRLRS